MAEQMRLALALLAVVATLCGCYNEAADYRSLVAHQKVANGRVVSTDCPNHGAVYYAFEVDGQRLQGQAPQGALLPACDAIPVGHPVQVFYDSSHPAFHTLIDPSRLYERERGYYVPYLWLAPFAILGLVLAIMRRRKAAHGQESHRSEAARS